MFKKQQHQYAYNKNSDSTKCITKQKQKLKYVRTYVKKDILNL